MNMKIRLVPYRAWADAMLPKAADELFDAHAIQMPWVHVNDSRARLDIVSAAISRIPERVHGALNTPIRRAEPAGD